MRKFPMAVLALVLVLALLTPAFAHFLVNSKTGQVGWVGSPPLPAAAQGQGLDYSPGAQSNISPSHAKGLNTACYALRGNPAVVDIYGPPLLIDGNPSGCPHGQ
jgi:hypothetical protein